MRNALGLMCIALCVITVTPGRCQTGRSLPGDFENAGSDMLFIWSAPGRVTAGDLSELTAFAAASGAALVGDEALHRWIREHPQSIPLRALAPFREDQPANLIGRTFVLLPLSGGLYLAGLAFENGDLRDAGMGAAASNLSTTLARSALAHLMGRLRPRNDQGAFVIQPLAFGDWDMRSFPAGHAANIMACASFWNHRFDLGVAEPVLYSLATAVSLARVADEAHWMSDTVAGGVLGYVIGKAVADRYRDRESERILERDVRARSSTYFVVRLSI